MIKQTLSGGLVALSIALLAACGGTPYSPQGNNAAAVNTDDFEKNVDSFAVLLDTSGSMNDETQASARQWQEEYHQYSLVLQHCREGYHPMEW